MHRQKKHTFLHGGIFMDCEKLGQLILQLRKEKGLTQQEIAMQLNISNKTVSNGSAEKAHQMFRFGRGFLLYWARIF